MHKLLLIFSVIFLLQTTEILSLNVPTNFSEHEKLDVHYGPGDGVKELNSHNFESNVFRSRKIWFVEFYTTNCPYCRKFAPIYVKVAKSVSG